MTERGLPIAAGAPACPFVAFDDARDDRADHPDPRHRCYAESPPSPRARAHQEAYCLSANFPVCPTFQDWARREAARVLPGSAGGTPAERLRDVPAQREAGSRPPAFGPQAGPSDWPVSHPPAPAPGVPGGVPDAAPGNQFAHAAPGASPDPLLDRLGGAHGHDESDDDERLGDGSPGSDSSGLDAHSRDPWDLPVRRVVQPEWSSPPPWAGSRPPGDPASDEVDAPEFLRGAASAPAPRDDTPWLLSARDDDEDPAAADGREATMARLRQLGMGDVGPDEDRDANAAMVQRSATSLGRSVAEDDGLSAGQGFRAGPAAGLAGAPDRGAGPAAGRAASVSSDSAGRSSGGLGRLLGLDRRPKAGSPRAVRRAEKEPAWEKPRRFEAYPTLKTRVGMPAISRIWLAAGALVVAALILFFVPPLLLNQGTTGGPGATRTPAASGAGVGSGAVGSPSRSVGPTAKPVPTAQTYTIKQGDTLSSIAKKFKITVDQLLAANKQIKNPNKIAVGDVLTIPTAAPSEVIDGGASASP